jgi:hypothetical protein
MHIVKNVKHAAPATITLLFGMMLSLFSGSRVYAQLTGAILSGIVRDPSGAVVPNAAIAIKNASTDEVLTSPSFCTNTDERVYITARACELAFGATGGL